MGFYDLLEDNMLMVIEESKQSRKMLGDLNATFIALTPKKNNFIIFKDFEPISHCNLVHKILLRIIANRILKMALFSIDKFMMYLGQIEKVSTQSKEGSRK